MNDVREFNHTEFHKQVSAQTDSPIFATEDLGLANQLTYKKDG